jgi:hypothetical protein
MDPDELIESLKAGKCDEVYPGVHLCPMSDRRVIKAAAKHLDMWTRLCKDAASTKALSLRLNSGADLCVVYYNHDLDPVCAAIVVWLNAELGELTFVKAVLVFGHTRLCPMIGMVSVGCAEQFKAKILSQHPGGEMITKEMLHES